MKEDFCRADWFPEGKIDSVDVAVSMDDPQQLRIVFADGRFRHLPLEQVSVSDYIEGVPLKVAAAGSGMLSIPDGPVAQGIARRHLSVGARVERRFFLWLPGLLLGGALVFALLILVVVPRTAEHLAPLLPSEWVHGLGELVYKQVERWTDVEPVGQEEILAAAEIDRIGQELIAPLDDDYPFRFLLDRTEGRLNAFALPDGTILFTYALYTELDEDEVAGILAHEIAHVTERHGVEALLASSAWFVLAAFLFPDPSLFAYIPTLAELSYSREAELEADCVAAEILTRAGYPAIAIASALERFEEALSKKGGGKADSDKDADEGSDGIDIRVPWELLSTHPAFPERSAYARRCAALEG